MLSVDSPQSVEKTVQTEHYETLSEQLTAMKLKEPVVESGVPVDVRDAIKQCYGLEEDAKFFVLPDNPNKLFVFHRGRLRTINLLTWKAFQQGDISLSNDEIKLNPETPSDDNEMDGQVAPPTTPVTPFRPMSLERCKLPNRFDWQKSMSDRERQYLQKERRRSTAFKTSLCNEFRITGSCSYGVSCRFAHGEIELRPVPGPHPKYKTQLCNKFALYGSCPYGARCQFIHMRPCEARNDDYSGRLNFSGSFDGCNNYRYRFDGRLGYYVCEPPGPQCCVMFPEQFMPSNGLPEISSVGLSPHQFTPNTFWPHPSSSQVLQSPSTDSCFQGTFMLPVSSSNMLNSSAAKVDDFFTTLSTGEMSNPFTQSCFPRINLDGSSLNSATVTDSNIQANFVSND